MVIATLPKGVEATVQAWEPQAPDALDQPLAFLVQNHQEQSDPDGKLFQPPTGGLPRAGHDLGASRALHGRPPPAPH